MAEVAEAVAAVGAGAEGVLFWGEGEVLGGEGVFSCGDWGGVWSCSVGFISGSVGEGGVGSSSPGSWGSESSGCGSTSDILEWWETSYISH